jgi:5-methylcytosine-specific restriction enzyme B
MANDVENQLFVEGKGSSATGSLTENGFLVLKGALLRREFMTSASASMKSRRSRMLAEDGLLEANGDQLTLTRDYLFQSPSGAASSILGRASNGWHDWKHADGRTLSQVKRVSRPGVMLSTAKRNEILSEIERAIHS